MIRQDTKRPHVASNAAVVAAATAALVVVAAAVTVVVTVMMIMMPMTPADQLIAVSKYECIPGYGTHMFITVPAQASYEQLT